MPSIKSENKSNETSEKNINFLEWLNGSWSFRQKLSDYTIPIKILIVLARVLTSIVYAIIYVLTLIVSLIIEICKSSKTATIIVICALILIVVGTVDYIVNYGKVYPGVYVGDVDLGGKTVEEAENLIENNFSYRLSGNEVIIFVDEEAKETGLTDDSAISLNEQLSVDEARQTVKYWKTNSVELEASFPTKDILDQAVNSTRGLLNLPKRLGAMLFKQVIKPYADFNEDAIAQQISRVNDTIGTPVINPTCAIEEAVAYPINGSDGMLVDNNEFRDQLNEAFFQKEPINSNFVPKLHVAKQLVSYKSAELLAEKINSAFNKKVHFSYKDISWEVDKLILGSWINIGIENRPEENSGCSCSSLNGQNYCLVANIDSNKAGFDIFAHTRNQNITTTDYAIKFLVADTSVSVLSDVNFDMPSVYDAINKLNEDWLENAVVYENNKNKTKTNNESTDTVNIKISVTKIPEKLSLDEALNIGVVSVVSTYTTTYSSGAGTENRNHNIALGAALLNNSICYADGGTWSFNKVCGDASAERGFLEAGSIVGNRYTKSVGGGICQVATTVFNAVYEGGYPVISRHNHDLHMASYPAGRDAAISYPDLDLIWQNNETSDILVRTNTTGYSVTVDLIGVDSQYIVKTEVGEWVEGEHYASENVIDPAKEPNSKFTQTSGSDGKSIVIKRFVYDRNGQLMINDEFVSYYKPKTEIIVYGPGDEANKLFEAKQARMKREDDNW